MRGQGRLGGSLALAGVAHIQRNRGDPSRELPGQASESLRATGGRGDQVAGTERRAGESVTQATAGPGDQP